MRRFLVSGYSGPAETAQVSAQVLDVVTFALGGVVDGSSCRALIAMRSVIDQLCLGLFRPF